MGGDHSQSGYAALLVHIRGQGLDFTQRIASGAHLQSARMVATGAADIAAVDALSWRHMQRFDDWVHELRVLEWTAPPTTTLPFVTAKGRDPAPLFEALQRGLASLSQEDRDTLGLKAILRLPVEDYFAVEDI